MKKLRNPINGWILLDKPVGLGSTNALGWVKRLLKPEKAGHAGTLDPAASGILAIALGEATKAVPLMMEAKKTYEFQVNFGAQTDTDDNEGKVIKTSDNRPTLVQIEAAFSKFIGKIMQTPPKFSAIRIDGKRAYDLARGGQDMEMKQREIEVLDLVILSKTKDLNMDSSPSAQNDKIYCKVTCSKGTYVRSIARDLGEMLGCYAHASGIRRTQLGGFSIKNTISLEKLEEMVHKACKLEEIVLPVEAVLDDILVLQIPPQSAVLLRNGQKIALNQQPSSLQGFPVVCNGKLVAIGKVDDGFLKPMRIFNH
jgi:tRNA pseudouridine55 synthase